MAVVVETGSLLLPMTLCGSAGHGAPRPPLRQATGCYMTFDLVRCEFIANYLKMLQASHMQIIDLSAMKRTPHMHILLTMQTKRDILA